MATGLLFGICDNDISTDVLYVERSESCPIVAVATIAFFVRIREKSIEVMYAMESCVIHLDSRAFEISNIQETLPVMLCDGGSFVDSFPGIIRNQYCVGGINSGVPSSNS